MTLYSYGRYSYGLYSYGPIQLWPYIVMAYVVMAYVVMARLRGGDQARPRAEMAVGGGGLCGGSLRSARAGPPH